MNLTSIAEGVRRVLALEGIAAEVEIDSDEHVALRFGNAGGLLSVGTRSSVQASALRVTISPVSGDQDQATLWFRNEYGAVVTCEELNRLLPAHIGHRLAYRVPVDGHWVSLEPQRLGCYRFPRTSPLESNPDVPRMTGKEAALPADVQLTIQAIQRIFDLDPNRLPREFDEFIRFEMQRRSRAFREDAVLTADQMNDLFDRLVAVERWMARYAPHLERLAGTVRPASADILLNTATPEDDQ
ncbi:MAG: hypothetical protein IPN34_17650 [Planctomycetes bacterium]|nr:hypothetical protein [Planctomycetota bacterium]